jgi:hypothetical protein
MPRNPSKTRCSHPGCHAWSVRGSDPPLCSTHAGRHLYPGPGKKLGAPAGNQNALTHGFYSDVVRDYAGEPVPSTGGVSLDDEIAIARVALRRILAMLLSGTTLGPVPRRLDTLDLARLGALAFQGTRTIARLLEVQASLGAEGGSDFAIAINNALDALSQEWGVDL